MLYFIGYPPNEGNWTGNFTNSVRNEFQRLHVPFTELPPCDWVGATAPKSEYLKINSAHDDVWFISWAQSSIIEFIKNKPGKKFGLVVGLTEKHLDPLVLCNKAELLRERHRLNMYDKVFANSFWCRDCIISAYPEMAGRIAVTGFPFDFTIFNQYKRIPKEDNLVVFNQRFALEKLHLLELETALLLVNKGFKVKHLSGIPRNILLQNKPMLRPLLERSDQIGLEFIYNSTKHEYHRNLAKASVVITTSIADMLPSSLIEAICLGAVPVAPRAFCFPEFVHKDNLYTPYDLTEIISITTSKPYRKHSIEQYTKERVLRNFLLEMEWHL